MMRFPSVLLVALPFAAQMSAVTFNQEIGLGAHAHNIARKLTMTATLPDGDKKTLLLISDWDFAWQDRYFFKHPVELPKGTRLDVELHWDNSTENPRNPSNPPIRVAWGEETKDEMGSISLIAVSHDESDHKVLQGDIAQRQREFVRARMKADPALALKVAGMLSE